MQPYRPKLVSTKVFFIPLEENENLSTTSEIPCYHNGPDPVGHIDHNGTSTENELSKVCHFARQMFQLGLTNFNDPSVKDWNSCFTAEALQGKSMEFAVSLNYAYKVKGGDLAQNSQLIFHDISAFMPPSNDKTHIFQIISANNGSAYLIDLTIRQYINSGLKLKNEEAAIFDDLLKKGFIQLTQETFTAYLNFFLGRNEFDQFSHYIENEWTLSSKNALPVNLASLKLYLPSYQIPVEVFKSDPIIKKRVDELFKTEKLDKSL